MNLASVKTHLTNTFGWMGTTADKNTACPVSHENRATIAWEYFVADFACSYWTKRKKKAKELAEASGILIPADPGDTAKCYTNEFIEIMAKTNQPSRSLDPQLLVMTMVKVLKMDLSAATALVESCKSDNNPATTYSVVATDA